MYLKTDNAVDEKFCKLLLKILIDEIEKQVKNENPIAVLFSGGIDSSIIATILEKIIKKNIILYTIGLSKSKDILNAQRTKSFFASKHIEIIVSTEDVSASYLDLIKLLPKEKKVEISYSLPLFMLLKKINEKVVASGHGADTLFGGFFKYKNSKNLKNDILQNSFKFIKCLPEVELKIAHYFKKNLVMPFSSDAVFQFSQMLQKIDESYFYDKKILRILGKKIGLNSEIFERRKIAIQYGTGFIKILKTIWKNERN